MTRPVRFLGAGGRLRSGSAATMVMETGAELNWPVLLATGLAAERVTALLRKRSVRVAGGVLVMIFGLWTLPGPHQHWLMGH